MESLAGDVTRLRGSKIERRGGDIRTYPHALHRDGAENGVLLLVVQLAGHGAFDKARGNAVDRHVAGRSEEHTSELQSLMRISYAVFCLKKKHNNKILIQNNKSNTN